MVRYVLEPKRQATIRPTIRQVPFGITTSPYIKIVASVVASSQGGGGNISKSLVE